MISWLIQDLLPPFLIKITNSLFCHISRLEEMLSRKSRINQESRSYYFVCVGSCHVACGIFVPDHELNP